MIIHPGRLSLKIILCHYNDSESDLMFILPIFSLRSRRAIAHDCLLDDPDQRKVLPYPLADTEIKRRGFKQVRWIEKAGDS